MTENQIYQKMINILNDADFISKDKTAQGYKFRGIDDMYNALHPLFAKHGVFISSKVVNGFREERKSKSGGTLIYSIIDVEFTFWASDGSSVSSTMRGEAMDTSDKASNKAMSAALKYALIQAFLIPTEENIDTENDDHKPEPKVDEQTLRAYAEIKELFESAQTIGDLTNAKNILQAKSSLFTQQEINGLMGIGKIKAQEFENAK